MKTLMDSLAAVSLRFPTKVAVQYEEGKIEYRELYHRIIQWERRFRTLKIGLGDRVLLMIEDPVAFIVLWFALWKVKAVPIPLETKIIPAELDAAIGSSQCHFIVAAGESELKSKLVGGENLRAAEAGIRIFGIPDSEGKSAETTALFFYTSGTTGLPKCVIFSHQAMLENIFSLVRAIRLDERDLLLTPLSPVLPACIATAVLPALAVGAGLLLIKGGLPGKILHNLEESDATVFFAVPYLYELLLTTMSIRKSNSWRKVRLALTSSARLNGRLFDAFYEATRIPLRSIYCSSESGACTYNDSPRLASLRDSVGKPLEGVEIKIAAANGRPAAPGIEGEIWVRGSHLADGYFRRDQLQRQVFVDGWVKTGDLGRIDEGGDLFLTGRLSETINVSGYLVNPLEVERVLLEHPMVGEALVSCEPDAATGEKVVAKVVLKQRKYPVNGDDLLNFCAGRLNHYKIPREIRIVEFLEKSRYGKIKRA
jgi:long-chain acyl-CoA synthetase